MSATTKSFTQDTAEKLGVSVRTVERTMQMMKGLTQETRDVFRHYPNYRLSQSNAAKLSRLEPAKQKTAAILLATHQIGSVDEYEPEQVEGRAPRKPKKDKEFLESVASLKDPTKVTLGSLNDPDLLLSDYRSMVHEMQRRMDSYCEPYYEEAVRSLSQSEIDELQSLADSCCEMMQNFIRQVKEGKWQQHA